MVGRTAIGWSTGDTAYGAFSNAKGSSVLNSNFGLADSFDQIYSRSSGEAFHLITNSNNKLSSNTGGDNVALGFKSSAFGLQSVSLGMKSIASGTNALSVGTRSVARDSYSVAIGSESKGMGEASVAMGTFSNALGNYQLDLTKFNDINNDGYSTITQPEQTYQTSNGSGSLKDNSSKYQLITSTLKTGTDGSTTMESKITAQNTSSNKEDAALGVKAIALGDRSASVGVKTIANGTAALALGTESVARTNYAIAQGYQAKAWEEGAIAIGKKAKANAENAIVLGNESSSQSQNALVLGNNSSNQSQNGVVIGNNINLKDSYNDSVVIGNNSTVATNGETRGISSYSSAEIGGLTYGGFTGTPTSVFSIGPAGGRTLQHVAAGKLSADSMDAVNGSQLYRTNLALGNLATTLVSNLGGNAAVVKENGNDLGNLTFSDIGGTGESTVHNAIQKIANSTVTLESDNGLKTTAQNRQTNSSFGIKGATNGGITTTASGADVLISLDDKTKTTLDKVSTIEGELTKTKSDLATTKNNVTTIQNTVNQLSSGRANTALSNLTDEGKNAITGLVDVKSSSTALTVTPETDQSTQKKTFNLALNEDGIKELAGTKTLANDISTAKTQAINASKTYTDGKLGNIPLTAVNGNNNVAPTTITQAINQITSAVNSGWEIQQGSTKKGDIGAGKKVNFTDGNLTTANVEMSNDVATVKFDVQTTNLTNDQTTGAVSVANADKNKLVSAENIATAINKATSSLSSSLAFRGDDNANVKVDATGDTNTKVDLKKQALKVLGTKGQIKTNATSDGLTISLDSTITDTLTNLEKASSSAAGNITTIQNLLGNTAPTTTINGNTAAPTTISEAVQQLSTAVNTGWKLKENNADKGNVGATEAVDFINGSNTTAIVTAKTADKPAAVSFNVNTATLANNDSTGKIIAPTKDDADKLVTAGNLATVVNNAVDPSKLAANVKLSYTSTNDTSTATPAKQVSLSKGLNFKSLNNNLTITAKDDGAVEFEAKDWTDDINTAKAQAISDAQSYTDKKLGDTTTLTSVNGITTAPTSITQAINQITSAVNSGWEIQQGGTKKAEIGAGKKVNFADGKLTTASVEMPTDSNVATVKFDVQTTNLTNDQTTGAVSASDKTKLVTAGDIANAINTATSSLSSSLAFRGDNNKDVAATETGDTNTKVDLKKQALKVLGTSGYVTTTAEATETGKTLTIDLNKTLKEKLDNLPTNVKESLQTINNKIGTAPPTTENAKTPTSSDGLNGKSLTEQIHALRDGLAGNVVYTNQDGERLVKGSDGKYYVAEKVGDKVQGPNGKWYPKGTTFKEGNPITKDGSPATALADADTPKEVAKDSIVSTAVNPDGSTEKPIQMGNVKSGLGLDETATPITAKKAKEAIAGADGKPGLLTKSGAGLNKVATVGDLQALAQAGIDFLGNEAEGKAIHKTLGSTLKIEGKSNTTYGDDNKANYSADNLITHNDKGTLRIEMLKTPTFEGVKLAANEGTPISLTPSKDGSSLTLSKPGDDGSSTMPVELKGIAAGKTENSAINKGQLDELKNQLGLSDTQEVSPTDSPAGKDGLDGKTLTEKTNALRDGLAGNVVYTNQDGKRLVKGSDGKYYVAEKVGDKVQGPNGKWYPEGTTFKDGEPIAKDGSSATALADADTPKEVAKDSIVSTAVNPDGSTEKPIQMGNVKSGLGLDETATPITAKKAKEAIAGADGKPGLLTKSGAGLNKVATVGDLQALAQAGIDFLGNEAEGKAIHKTLGSTLKIEGKSNTTYGDDNKANYSADNLITHNDKGTLRIEMLKTPTFEGVKLAANEGTPISLTPSKDGSSLTLSKPGDDGSSTMPVELKGIAAGKTENSAINKAQLDKLKNQLGLSDTQEVSPTDSPAGKDGLDGKTLTEKTTALRDGLAGNVVYTDPDGNRLVKGNDGKYYVAEKVGDKVQGPNGKWYPEGTTFKDGEPIAKDGSSATALADADTPKEVAKDSIVSTAVNPDGSTTSPVQMGNVKSGLGLDKTAEPITAKKAKEAIAGADGQSGLLAMKGANNLNKVATIGDLQALAQAGLDFNGNNTSTIIHRPLGTKLEIVGDNSATDFTSAVGNINVFGDPTNNKLVIQLNKVLTNITSIGGGVKGSVTDKTSTKPEDQKAQLTFNDDDLALNNKTLSGVKSAIKPTEETQGKTMLDHLKDAAENKGSSVVNVEDLAGVTAALETKLETELTDKGLSFGGDSGEKVSRKLGEQLNVKGGVTDPAKLTDDNIGVVTDPDNNALIVKLAKEISNISSITTETKDGQSATFNSAGMTITGSDDKAGQSASYGLGGTTLTNGENKAELKPESLTFSDATNPDGAKSSLSKDSLNFTKEDGSKGISVNGKDGTISNLADRTLVGKDGNGPLSSDYGTGDNRNNAATEGALKDLADKLGVSTPNTLPIDSTTGPSGADGLNGTSVLDKIQALRDGTAGNTVYTNEQGERLVKITTPDGSSAYYKAGDLTKDPTTGALTPNPNTTPVPSTNIVISNVNPDGSTTSPTQIANVKSGLGLDGSAGNNGVDGNPANPQAITADAAKKAIAGTDGQSGLLTKSGADLNKVATVGDLQALAQAGLDFVGNNEENVHRPLGTQLKVVGDGVDAAKAESFESATGNINVKSNATDNSLTVQLAKDLKNLTSSEFKDAEGNTTTVNGAGITITPPAKDDGSVAPSVSLSSKGLDNGGNKITNLAKGEDDGDAVTIAQLKELTQAVTGSSNINIANKEVNKDNKGLDDGTIFEGETSGDVLVQDGKPVLKTYNVSDQKEYLTNSVYTAISNMNEQGIKFFHTNDGETKQTDQASNTEDSSASGAYATAVGYQSSAEGENSLAMGSGSVVKGENSIVIGSEGSVHGSDSISVGTGNEVFGNNSGAFGDPSIINATSSYLVGNNSTLGSGDELTALVEERKALTRPTRPGKLEKKGTDETDQDYQNRVNAYLEKMAEYNTALADYMEKREAINEKITALSEKTQGVMAMGNNVTVTQGSHGALVMGSNSYVNVLNSGLDTNIQGIAIGNNTRVDTNASSVALGSGAHALQSLEALQSATVYAHEQAVGKGSEVIGEVSFGKEGEYRRLTNVAAGAADTDAVNVSQLKGVASNINQQLNNLSQNISGVAASSAAMANLPQAYLPGKSMVAVSTGYHKGQSAIALGVSRIADNGNLIIRASASHNTQNDFTGGIGVGYQW
ncbi:YadA-like family protein [Gallibacterium sp. ZY190522]